MEQMWLLTVPLLLAAVMLLAFVGCQFRIEGLPSRPYVDAVGAEASLEAYWHLSEPAGATEAIDSKDQHGGGYTAEVTLGAPTLLQGANPPESAARFEGGLMIVEYDADSARGPALNPPQFSVEALVADVSSSGSPQGGLVSSVDPNNHTGYALVAGESGFWEGWLGDGKVFQRLITSQPIGNDITHLVMTFDGAAVEIYADGLSVGRQDITSFQQNEGAALQVGGGVPQTGGATRLHGRVGHVAIYHAALNQVEVITHAVAVSYQKPTVEPTPVTECPPVPSDFSKAAGVTTATLRGTVDPHGVPTTFFFQWGSPPDFPNATPKPLGLPVVPVGSGPVLEFAQVPVTPGVQYHHRIVAVDAAGNPVPGTECSFVAPDLYRDQVVANIHLVGYWRLDETPVAGVPPTVAADSSSGHGNPGTYINMAVSQFGVPGIIPGNPAVSFPAGTGPSPPYIQIPQLVASFFSVEFWFRSTAGLGTANTQWWQGAGLVDGDVPTVGDDFGTSLDTAGRVWAGVGNPDTSIHTPPGFNDGKWHHVVFTRVSAELGDGGDIQLFVDGTRQANGVGGTQDLTASRVLSIGMINSDLQTGQRHRFVGSLDEVALYGTALDPDTITTHYNLGRPV